MRSRADRRSGGRVRTVAVGRRVMLRPPMAQDREEFLAKVQQSRSLHRPWVEPPDTSEAFDDWLRNGRFDRYQRFFVCKNDDDSLVGYIGLLDILRGAYQGAYIGYYAFSGTTGHGYMTEGMKLVLQHAFTVVALHRLEANIQPENESSLALVRRLGFRREGYSPRYLKIRGRWRDHERWAMTIEDWRVGS